MHQTVNKVFIRHPLHHYLSLFLQLGWHWTFWPGRHLSLSLWRGADPPLLQSFVLREEWGLSHRSKDVVLYLNQIPSVTRLGPCTSPGLTLGSISRTHFYTQLPESQLSFCHTNFYFIFVKIKLYYFAHSRSSAPNSRYMVQHSQIWRYHSWS